MYVIGIDERGKGKVGHVRDRAKGGQGSRIRPI